MTLNIPDETPRRAVLTERCLFRWLDKWNRRRQFRDSRPQRAQHAVTLFRLSLGVVALLVVITP